MKASPIALNIRPSRSLTAAVAAIHFLACGAVLLANLPGLWSVATLVIIVVSYVVTRRGGKEGMMRCNADGGLAERIGDEWLNAELLPEAVVLSWLVVFRYRLDGSNRTVTKIVLPDSVVGDEFRRFRVWLRWRTSSQFTLRHDA